MSASPALLASVTPPAAGAAWSSRTRSSSCIRTSAVGSDHRRSGRRALAPVRLPGPPGPGTSESGGVAGEPTTAEIAARLRAILMNLARQEDAYAADEAAASPGPRPRQPPHRAGE